MSYLSVIKSVGELNSKPTQQSVHVLNSMGIQQDFLVTRSEQPIDQKRRERLALFCNMQDEDIIANPDLESIYEVPLLLEEQNFSNKLLKKLGLTSRTTDLQEWGRFVRRLGKSQKEVKIAMVGKYFATGNYVLKDSYICVIEAIKHACSFLGVTPNMTWINANDKFDLRGYDGIVVPQGWGKRGIEGKIAAVKIARENKIPFLGLCFGMQMAVIEFARNVCKLAKANSTEVDAKTKFPVIHVMPEQKKYLEAHQYGGTIRLGAWPCKIVEGTLLRKIYGQENISERHRHRYELNNEFRGVLEKKGLVISGVSPDGQLAEAIELPRETHPFFVGTQFHPEYKSWPLTPHPIFMEFIRACRSI